MVKAVYCIKSTYLIEFLERLCGRVVRAARLWCRKSPYGCEFEAGLCHAMIGKLSLSAQQLMGTFFVREG